MNAAPPAMKYSKEAAKQAGEGARIESTGAYTGILTKVKWTVAQSNAAGYELDFKSTTGQVAERLTIYTIGRNGQALKIGENNIAALLCCLGVKEANPQTGQVQEYDFESKQKVLNNVYLFPDAMNKPIGLVLQKDTYTKANGDDGVRMQLECAFHAETKRTAKEMIDQTDAENIDKILEYLGDKDSRKTPSNGQATHTQQSTSSPAVYDDFDDSIPF